ncbi:uncharacterized protein JCM15063_005895 [Sporobolomyces koalae]|uniref:uncharacterized protein n=1 Tax=Sporobolomyces koalae TaxID=500713 RepID=UPI00317AD0EB
MSNPSAREQQSAEKLEVPVLPPSSSRFVLPPPPSDLLNRLQAFLPQIKQANEQLSGETGEPSEEAVVMEEISSDSDSDSDSTDSDSDSSSEEDEDEQKEEEGPSEPPSTMDRLMSISQPTTGSTATTKKTKILVQEES